MKVIHRIDRNFDHCSISPHGHAQFDVKTFDGRIDVIAIHFQWFAAGERSASIELSAIGASRKIAEEGDAKLAGFFSAGLYTAHAHRAEVEFVGFHLSAFVEPPPVMT